MCLIWAINLAWRETRWSLLVKEKHQATAESQNTHHFKEKSIDLCNTRCFRHLVQRLLVPRSSHLTEGSEELDWTGKIKWRQRAQVLIKKANRHLSKRFRSGIPSDRLLKGCSECSFPKVSWRFRTEYAYCNTHRTWYAHAVSHIYKLLGIIVRKVKAHFHWFHVLAISGKNFALITYWFKRLVC